MKWTDPERGDHVSLVDGEIDVAATINIARDKRAGAVSTFLGTTRDTFEGKVVTSLSYESYSDMAIESMKVICKKIRDKWDVIRVVITHKLGECPTGEISVLIAISSPHRKESLDAVSFAIDELKSTVPIWKKEIYEAGDSSWKANADVNEYAIPLATVFDQVTNTNINTSSSS